MTSYIVHVFSRNRRDRQGPSGMVEIPGTSEKRTFNGFDDLREILKPAKKAGNEKTKKEKKCSAECLSLKKFELLTSLAEDELFRITDRLAIKNYRKNSTVISQEDANSFMYMILSGSVRVVVVNESGKELILAVHHAGDFFGEMSLIDGKSVSASVVAAEPSTIATISKEDFYDLLFTQKKILLGLLQVFCRRLRMSNKKIEMLSHTGAAHRVRETFLLLAGRHGVKSGDGIRLSVHVTHQDIAGMTGLTRETVTKVMNEMKEQGCISILGSKHIRLNPRFHKTGLCGRAAM